MSYMVDPRDSRYLIWTVTTSIGTKGFNRSITVCTKTDGDYVDSDAIVKLDVYTQKPTTGTGDPAFAGDGSIKTDKKAYQVNENIVITVTTNSSVKNLKLVSESGNILGKVSQSYIEKNDTVTWTVVTKFGTKGEARKIGISLIGENGIVSDVMEYSSDLYIYCSQE